MLPSELLGAEDLMPYDKYILNSQIAIAGFADDKHRADVAEMRASHGRR